MVSDALLGLIEHARRRAIPVEQILDEPNWLVLRCRAIDRLRRRKRRRGWIAAYERQPSDERVDTGPVRDRIDARRALELAGPGLDPGHLAALDVLYVQGGSVTELAAREGWSHPTARRRHAALLKRLRQLAVIGDGVEGELGSCG